MATVNPQVLYLMQAEAALSEAGQKQQYRRHCQQAWVDILPERS